VPTGDAERRVSGQTGGATRPTGSLTCEAADAKRSTGDEQETTEAEIS
jgi:hypothetical protein